MSEIVPPPFDLRCAESRAALIIALLAAQAALDGWTVKV